MRVAASPSLDKELKLFGGQVCVKPTGKLGRAAKLVGGTRAITASTQVYLRQLIDGDFVAALYNRDDSEALAITLHWGSMWMPTVQPMAVRDLWQHREVGVRTHNFTATVSTHGVKVFRFRQLAWRPPNRTRH